LQPFPATKAPAPGAVTTTTDQTRDASLDLHTVDWKNIAVPGPSCLRSADIQLHNGDALVPDHTNGHPIRPGSNGPRYDDLYQERVTYGTSKETGTTTRPSRSIAATTGALPTAPSCTALPFTPAAPAS
jgi:hypothetical protein